MGVGPYKQDHSILTSILGSSYLCSLLRNYLFLGFGLPLGKKDAYFRFKETTVFWESTIGYQFDPHPNIVQPGI